LEERKGRRCGGKTGRIEDTKKQGKKERKKNEKNARRKQELKKKVIREENRE